MGATVPKPFLPVAGVPLLIRTIRSLTSSALIKHLILVVAAEREPSCQRLLEQYGPFAAPLSLVHGGAERQDSVRLGLAALEPDCDIVVIHDAARPFITAEVIDQSVAVAAACGGALVAAPVRDTVKRVNPENVVIETISRHDLWLAQTPQTFQVPLIRDAHARAQQHGVMATDDAALVEWAGGQVKIVPGDARNFKITTPEDLQMAEAILRQA